MLELRLGRLRPNPPLWSNALVGLLALTVVVLGGATIQNLALVREPCTAAEMCSSEPLGFLSVGLLGAVVVAAFLHRAAVHVLSLALLVAFVAAGVFERVHPWWLLAAAGAITVSCWLFAWRPRRAASGIAAEPATTRAIVSRPDGRMRPLGRQWLIKAAVPGLIAVSAGAAYFVQQGAADERLADFGQVGSAWMILAGLSGGIAVAFASLPTAFSLGRRRLFTKPQERRRAQTLRLLDAVVVLPPPDDDLAVVVQCKRPLSEFAGQQSATGSLGRGGWLYGAPRAGAWCAIDIDGDVIVPEHTADVWPLSLVLMRLLDHLQWLDGKLSRLRSCSADLAPKPRVPLRNVPSDEEIIRNARSLDELIRSLRPRIVEGLDADQYRMLVFDAYAKASEAGDDLLKLTLSLADFRILPRAADLDEAVSAIENQMQELRDRIWVVSVKPRNGHGSFGYLVDIADEIGRLEETLREATSSLLEGLDHDTPQGLIPSARDHVTRLELLGETASAMRAEVEAAVGIEDPALQALRRVRAKARDLVSSAAVLSMDGPQDDPVAGDLLAVLDEIERALDGSPARVGRRSANDGRNGGSSRAELVAHILKNLIADLNALREDVTQNGSLDGSELIRRIDAVQSQVVTAQARTGLEHP